MKRTPWFDGTVKPVHKGVYERKYREGVVYNRWDGKKWCFPGDTAKAASEEVAPSFNQNISWRGILVARAFA